jgi:hypothetical protein
LLAALLYWEEEMLSHGRCIMRPYFRQIGQPRAKPLNRIELSRLRRRIRKHLGDVR